MTALRQFVRTSLLGGVVVLLPVAILLIVFLWVFNKIRALIQPLTNQVVAHSGWNEYLAGFIVVLLIIAACFFVGALVRTAVGKWFHDRIERHVLKMAPGYNLVKETVLQFFGDRPSPFSSVALVKIFPGETLVTAFVTDRHANGWFTVFVPTGPNPTSGNIYHVPNEAVHHLTVPVEDVMRAVISCGAGSGRQIESLEALRRDAEPPAAVEAG